MGAVVALSELFDTRQVWRGQAAPVPTGDQPTGWPELDAVLPSGGWPDASLSEVLSEVDGTGELRLVLPTVKRLTGGQRPVVLIAPPYAPCVAGWRQAGVHMGRVHITRAAEKNSLWAAEQCLRSGSCAAVLIWPHQADDQALRRLQVAADTGRALGIVFRDRRHVGHASPAALRLEVEAQTGQVWVRKCRGGAVPSHAVSFPALAH